MTTTEPDYTSAAKDLLRQIVAGYVSHPQALQIEASLIGTTIVMRLDPHAEDFGKIVGSRGNNFHALQTIFSAAAAKAGKRLNLILKDKPRAYCDLPPFRANPNWQRGPFETLLRTTLSAAINGEYTLSQGDVENTTVYEIGAVKEAEEVAKAVHTIFHAIGKAQGRFVLINFAPNGC